MSNPQGHTHDNGHDHDRGHTHDHNHDHNHGHVHEHDHGHVHDEDCGCGDLTPIGEIVVETNLHDEAIVVSGKLNLPVSDGDALRHILEEKISHIAHEISEHNGIIGHIKAVYSTTTTDMLSITDVDLTVKRSPEQNVDISLVAIVFAVDEILATTLVYDALHALKSKA